MAQFIRQALSSPRRSVGAAVSVLAWVPVLVFLSDNTLEIATVRGASMSPAFNGGGGPGSGSDPVSRDTVLLSRYRPSANVRRGDVVAYWSPRDPEKMAIKRVVAVENDRVSTRPPYPFRSETVPVGHVWVEGDNPEGRFSLDSNDFGPLAKSLIAGKVKARLWPNPTLVRPEEWESSEAGRKRWESRITRNAESQEPVTIFKG